MKTLLVFLFLAPLAWGADAELDRLVRLALQKDQVAGLAMGVVYEGKQVYLKGFGDESRAPRIPVDPYQTRFRWASVSKTLTAAVAIHGVSQGKLDLDADIRRYFPEYRLPLYYTQNHQTKLLPGGTQVTLRQLLNHTAGMQHYSNGKSSPTPPAVLAEDPNVNTGMAWALSYWMANPLVAIPGTAYLYSTPGFNLAGVVLEKALGKPFEILVRDWVGRPAGMSTLQPDSLWNPAPRRAKGYIQSGQGLVEEDDNDVTWKLAAGGFVSTGEDFTRYALALLGKGLLTEKEKVTLWTPSQTEDGTPFPYGLGWQVTSRNGRRVIRHSGAQQKARSLLFLVPDSGFALTFLTNAGHSVGLTDLAHTVEDLLRKRVALGESPIQE